MRERERGCLCVAGGFMCVHHACRKGRKGDTIIQYAEEIGAHNLKIKLCAMCKQVCVVYWYVCEM